MSTLSRSGYKEKTDLRKDMRVALKRTVPSCPSVTVVFAKKGIQTLSLLPPSFLPFPGREIVFYRTGGHRKSSGGNLQVRGEEKKKNRVS